MLSNYLWHNGSFNGVFLFIVVIIVSNNYISYYNYITYHSK